MDVFIICIVMAAENMAATLRCSDVVVVERQTFLELDLEPMNIRTEHSSLMAQHTPETGYTPPRE